MSSSPEPQPNPECKEPWQFQAIDAVSSFIAPLDPVCGYTVKAAMKFIRYAGKKAHEEEDRRRQG